jgi:hypothetical protein
MIVIVFCAILICIDNIHMRKVTSDIKKTLESMITSFQDPSKPILIERSVPSDEDLYLQVIFTTDNVEYFRKYRAVDLDIDYEYTDFCQDLSEELLVTIKTNHFKSKNLNGEFKRTIINFVSNKYICTTTVYPDEDLIAYAKDSLIYLDKVTLGEE